MCGPRRFRSIILLSVYRFGWSMKPVLTYFIHEYLGLKFKMVANMAAKMATNKYEKNGLFLVLEPLFLVLEPEFVKRSCQLKIILLIFLTD